MMNKWELVVYFSPLPLLKFFRSGLFTWAGPFGLGYVHPLFTRACSPFIAYLDLQNVHQ